MSNAQKLTVQKFKRLITKPPATPVLLTITPEVAYKALTYNEETLQRPVSFPTIKNYAEQMSNMMWRTAATPIAFDTSGGVQNGQHRLHAIVESGRSIDMWCFFGMDPSLFHVYDAGKKRTAGDIFSINGVSSPNQVSSIAKSIYKFLHWTNQDHWSMDKKIRKLEMKLPADAYSYYGILGGEQALRPSLTLYYKASSESISNPGPIGALHFLCSEIDYDMAKEFFDRLCTGANLGPRSPVKKLRDHYLRAHGSIMPLTTFGLTARCWNACRSKRRSFSLSPVNKWADLPKLV